MMSEALVALLAPLSVLVLVTELNRDEGSCPPVMVTIVVAGWGGSGRGCAVTGAGRCRRR